MVDPSPEEACISPQRATALTYAIEAIEQHHSSSSGGRRGGKKSGHGEGSLGRVREKDVGALGRVGKAAWSVEESNERSRRLQEGLRAAREGAAYQRMQALLTPTPCQCTVNPNPMPVHC